MAKYPHTPGFKTGSPETSRKAASEVADRALTLRMAVFGILTERGPRTADEVARILGEDVLSIRPRFSELRKLSLISATGERRVNGRSGKTACVWKVLPPKVKP